MKINKLVAVGLAIAVGTWEHGHQELKTVTRTVHVGETFCEIAGQVAPNENWHDVAYHTTIIRNGKEVNTSVDDIRPMDELIIQVPKN